MFFDMAKVVHTPGPARQTLTVALKGLGHKVGKAGWFPSAQYENIPVAQVAAAQEFGTGKIPPRSFQRTTAAEQAPRWRKLAAQNARAVLNGQMTPSEAMEIIAAQAAGDMRMKISKITSPALAQSTIDSRLRRASGIGKGKLTENVARTISKPLVDTGHMLDTLSHEVGDK